MTKWTLNVPEQIDQSVRDFLATHGAEPQDLSTFVCEAVGSEILRRTIKQIREANDDLSPEEAQALADDAVRWARAKVDYSTVPYEEWLEKELLKGLEGTPRPISSDELRAIGRQVIESTLGRKES